MIIGIVAVDRNLAIGKGGKLPWHYSADMKFFKATTIGNTVVMGRRTWETLKGPLKERTNIVLSREKNFNPADSLLVMRDVDSVLEFARGRDEHLFVMGGAKVYEAFCRRSTAGSLPRSLCQLKARTRSCRQIFWKVSKCTS